MSKFTTIWDFLLADADTDMAFVISAKPAIYRPIPILSLSLARACSNKLKYSISVQ